MILMIELSGSDSSGRSMNLVILPSPFVSIVRRVENLTCSRQIEYSAAELASLPSRNALAK